MKLHGLGLRTLWDPASHFGRPEIHNWLEQRTWSSTACVSVLYGILPVIFGDQESIIDWNGERGAPRLGSQNFMRSCQSFGRPEIHNWLEQRTWSSTACVSVLYGILPVIFGDQESIIDWNGERGAPRLGSQNFMRSCQSFGRPEIHNWLEQRTWSSTACVSVLYGILPVIFGDQESIIDWNGERGAPRLVSQYVMRSCPLF